MRALLLVAALVFVVACSSPAPPTLAPKSAVVTNVSPVGIGIDVTLLATNPNDVDLTAGDVRARVVLDKQVDIGAATVQQRVTLPAHQTTELKVAVSIPWNNVMPLMEIAMSNRRWIPYRIDGNLTLGGDLVAVQVPFTMEGNVSHEQIVRATLNSIPGIAVDPVDAAAPSPPPARRASPQRTQH
jgi:LEA14-like dessication related protein